VRASALPPAFYLNCDPCREDAVVVGVQWLWQQVKGNGGAPLIVTPVLDQVARLRASVPGASQIQAESQTTYSRSGWRGGPVLAVWPDRKMLTMLDDDWRVTAICAVPWVLDSLKDWIRGRQAKDLMGTAPTVTGPQLDPVVEQALESLTRTVNLGTALSNSMDKTAAVSYLRALERAGYKWSPEDILAWAMGHGWSNRGAQELADVARGVKEGRRFQVIKGALRSDPELIAYWKERAQQKADGNGSPAPGPPSTTR
jgi:hypothetical protein